MGGGRKARFGLMLEHYPLALFPILQPPPQILGIDIEHLADVVERKYPVFVLERDPFVSVAEQTLALAARRINALHKTLDCVFEHAQNQPLFTFEQMLPTHRLE